MPSAFARFLARRDDVNLSAGMAAGMDMMQWKVLVVTGGGRGIGAAVVRLAVARGWKVVFSYLSNEDAAAALESELNRTSRCALAVRGDVADEAFAPALFDAAQKAFGEVRGVVNNAGITGRIGPFVDIAPDTIRRVFETNVYGTMNVSREAVRRWQARGQRGAIVNISSVASTLGAPGEYVHYAASKAAIDAFTIGLSKEVAASGIRVNAVLPGTTYTDIHAAGGAPDRPERVAPRVPMQRIADPTEIAQAVLWLLSEEASYTTGATMRVSGGV